MKADEARSAGMSFSTQVLLGMALLLLALIVGSYTQQWVVPSRTMPQIVYDSSRNVTEGWKIWFALAALVVIGRWQFFEDRPRRWFLGFLTVLCLVNYARWGPKSTVERVDAYDMVHYYLNTKYMDELGYWDLYACAILADHENGGPRFKKQGPVYMAQDEAGHKLQPIGHAIARGKKVRADKFTPERWEQFEHDFLYLQRDIRGFTRWHNPEAIPPSFSNDLWKQMIQDHGFNGTPAWTLVARPIASVVPVEAIKLLGFLDLFLFMAAVGAVVWAYGGTAGMITVIWLATTYSMRWPTLTWAFLRYDYVCMLIIATAMLKKNAHAWAGVATAYAATGRFFPALWMWGPFMKGVSGLVRGKVSKPLLFMAAAFLIGVVALQAGAAARFGPSQVQSHFENMMDHNDPLQLSSRRIGMALGLTHKLAGPTDLERLPRLLSKERKQVIADQKPVRLVIAGVFLLIMGWGLRRLRDDEAFGFGFLPFFLLTTASYYYYVARATLVVIHAGDLDKSRNRVGLVLLFSMEVFCNYAARMHGSNRMFLIGYLSWLMMAYALVMCAYVMWESSQAEEEEADTAEA